MPEDESAASTDTPDWAEIYRSLVTAPTADLDASESEALAVAAYLVGDEETSAAAWESAHRRHLDAGERAEAARCSFWLAFCLMLRGQMAHAGGWLSRTESVLGGDLDCAASGYLLIPALLGALEGSDFEAAQRLAEQAVGMADEFGDPDLGAFATLGLGQSLIAKGQTQAGVRKLDEAMLPVAAGAVGPIASGVVYCAVILECMQLFDLPRASEWTASLDEWCRSQPNLVPYRGQCLVHQSQLRQAAGDWSEATTLVSNAREHLANPPHPALGMACYQEGELFRLRGLYDEAAAAYDRASRTGYEPMPGSALLQLEREQVGAASASIRRALEEATPTFRRTELLPAAVEVFRGAGDRAAARQAADALRSIAAGERSVMLAALADRAIGSVLLDEGDVTAALAELRAAATAFQRLNMPHEAARSEVLVGLGCAALEDRSSARRALTNAREVFDSLGALPDLSVVASHVERLDAPSAPAKDGILSARELEVLREVAAGKTNPGVAGALTISQHTVGRHLENIFTKLGVNSRAAATAYAYQHNLL